jgi:folylpolyglutamate synthase/dihydropteroate synthase
VLSDKDASGIWAEIKGKISEAIRFRIPSTRTWTVQDTRIDGVMMESIDEAWLEALSRESWAKNQPWLIFGSVAAVGEVFAYWQRAGWSVERITQK